MLKLYISKEKYFLLYLNGITISNLIFKIIFLIFSYRYIIIFSLKKKTQAQIYNQRFLVTINLNEYIFIFI